MTERFRRGRDERGADAVCRIERRIGEAGAVVIRGNRQAQQREIAADMFLQNMLALAGDPDRAGPERPEFPMQRRARRDGRLVIRLQALL